MPRDLSWDATFRIAGPLESPTTTTTLRSEGAAVFGAARRLARFAPAFALAVRVPAFLAACARVGAALFTARFAAFFVFLAAVFLAMRAF
jgi:hypothetical protein